MPTLTISGLDRKHLLAINAVTSVLICSYQCGKKHVICLHSFVVNVLDIWNDVGLIIPIYCLSWELNSVGWAEKHYF